MSHIKQLNVKGSKMWFREEMSSTRRSYVKTALAKITGQLTAETNEQVNNARENIIRQFEMIETKKKNKKQKKERKVQENNYCS